MRVGVSAGGTVLGVLVTALAVAVLGGAGVAQSASSADLAVMKSDSPDPVGVNSALTYTILVTNAGPDPAENAMLTDKLPSGVNFISADTTQGSCKNKGHTTTCTLGTIGNGGTSTNSTPVTVT